MSNVAKVQLRWQYGGSVDAWSVCHVKSVDSHEPYDEDDLLQIALAFEGWWRGVDSGVDYFMAGLYPNEIVLEEVIVTRIRPDESEPYSLIIGEAGTSFGSPPWLTYGVDVESMPPQCCWLITLHTETESRRGRGRIYLPSTDVRRSGVALQPEYLYAVGFIPEAVRDLIALGIGWLLNRLSNAGDAFEYFLAVWSEVANDSYAVTYFDVVDLIRTQRRRGLYPGTRHTYGLDGSPA